MSDPESSGVVGHSSSRLMHRRPNSDGCGVEIYISFSHSNIEGNSTTNWLTQIKFAGGDDGGDFQSLAMGLQQTHTARYQHKAAYDPQKE
jgi:hypothetical protein